MADVAGMVAIIAHEDDIDAEFRIPEFSVLQFTGAGAPLVIGWRAEASHDGVVVVGRRELDVRLQDSRVGDAARGALEQSNGSHHDGDGGGGGDEEQSADLGLALVLEADSHHGGAAFGGRAAFAREGMLRAFVNGAGHLDDAPDVGDNGAGFVLEFLVESDDGDGFIDAREFADEDAGDVDLESGLAIGYQDLGPSGFAIDPLVVFDAEDGRVEGEGALAQFFKRRRYRGYRHQSNYYEGMENTISRLAQILERVPKELGAIDEAASMERRIEGKWCAKEVLGRHLSSAGEPRRLTTE